MRVRKENCYDITSIFAALKTNKHLRKLTLSGFFWTEAAPYHHVLRTNETLIHLKIRSVYIFCGSDIDTFKCLWRNTTLNLAVISIASPVMFDDEFFKLIHSNTTLENIYVLRHKLDRHVHPKPFDLFYNLFDKITSRNKETKPTYYSRLVQEVSHFVLCDPASSKRSR